MSGHWPFFFKYVGGGWLVGTAVAVAAAWVAGFPEVLVGVGSIGGMLVGGKYGLRREFRE